MDAQCCAPAATVNVAAAEAVAPWVRTLRQSARNCLVATDAVVRLRGLLFPKRVPNPPAPPGRLPTLGSSTGPADDGPIFGLAGGSGPHGVVTAADVRARRRTFLLNKVGGVAAVVNYIRLHGADEASAEAAVGFLHLLLGGMAVLGDPSGKRPQTGPVKMRPRTQAKKVARKLVAKGLTRVLAALIARHKSGLAVRSIAAPAARIMRFLGVVDAQMPTVARVSGALLAALRLTAGFLSNPGQFPLDQLLPVVDFTAACVVTASNVAAIANAREPQFTVILQLMRYAGGVLASAAAVAVVRVCAQLLHHCAVVDAAFVARLVAEGTLDVAALCLSRLVDAPEPTGAITAIMELLECVKQSDPGSVQRIAVAPLLFSVARHERRTAADVVALSIALCRYYGMTEVPCGRDAEVMWTVKVPPDADALGDSSDDEAPAKKARKKKKKKAAQEDESESDGGDAAPKPQQPLTEEDIAAEAALARYVALLCPELDPAGSFPIHADTALSCDAPVAHVMQFDAPGPSRSPDQCTDCFGEDLAADLSPSDRRGILLRRFRRFFEPAAAVIVYDDLPRSTALPAAYADPSGRAGSAPAYQTPPLRFASRFEGGNLKRAIRVGEFEYDLVLRGDTNTFRQGGWFFFGVEGAAPAVDYRFNIVNFAKAGSLYGDGQRPLLFSEREFESRKAGWMRVGHEIVYHRNSFAKTNDAEQKAQPGESKGGTGRRSSASARGDDAAPRARTASRSKGTTPKRSAAASGTENLVRKRAHPAGLFTCHMTVQFPAADDRAFLATCFPYTFSDMMAYVRDVARHPLAASCIRLQNLAQTDCGNAVPMLTITDFRGDSAEIMQRPVAFISARVHPSETVASFAARGLIDFLLDQNSACSDFLRRSVVWKVVPMLNPDGAVHGHTRCDLNGLDLNRAYKNPLFRRTPTVSSILALARHIEASGRRIIFYGDFHGHSRKPGCFTFACGSAKAARHGVVQESVFPAVLHTVLPTLLGEHCTYKVERGKATTGRVVLNRELGVRSCFTLEISAMGGVDTEFTTSSAVESAAPRGPRRVTHFSTRGLRAIGAMFIHSVGLMLMSARRLRGEPTPPDEDFAKEFADMVLWTPPSRPTGGPLLNELTVTPVERRTWGTPEWAVAKLLDAAMGEARRRAAAASAIRRKVLQAKNIAAPPMAVPALLGDDAPASQRVCEIFEGALRLESRPRPLEKPLASGRRKDQSPAAPRRGHVVAPRFPNGPSSAPSVTSPVARRASAHGAARARSGGAAVPAIPPLVLTKALAAADEAAAAADAAVLHVAVAWGGKPAHGGPIVCLGSTPRQPRGVLDAAPAASDDAAQQAAPAADDEEDEAALYLLGEDAPLDEDEDDDDEDDDDDAAEDVDFEDLEPLDDGGDAADATVDDDG